MNNDLTTDLQQQVTQAASASTRLTIQAGGSKSFLGTLNDATQLNLSSHSGIISYEPTELVITARSGTTLEALNTTLAESGQSLAFEPPAFGASATIGGTIACAMAGPAKPYLGGTRDYILGCHILNGRGELLKFGGEVMKNVAGYDVSRLMTGAMGTLGVLMDVSIKVLPTPEQSITLAYPTDAASAIEEMQTLAGLGLPVTASAYIGDTLYTRVSGTEASITASAKKIKGELSDQPDLWRELREQTLPFFDLTENQTLWRISTPALTPPLNLNGEWLYDWAGMQRWLITEDSASSVRSIAQSAGGHATIFRSTDALKRAEGTFHPLPGPLLALHKRLKQEFDPNGVFNHQRLFQEF